MIFRWMRRNPLSVTWKMTSLMTTMVKILRIGIIGQEEREGTKMKPTMKAMLGIMKHIVKMRISTWIVITSRKLWNPQKRRREGGNQSLPKL